MSSIPFDELESKQVLIIPPGQVRFIKWNEVHYHADMQGVLEDGTILHKGGIEFHLESVYPDDRSVVFRLWNKRSIAMFRPLIETGAARGRWVKVFKTGEGPSSDYVPTLQPKEFEPGPGDLTP